MARKPQENPALDMTPMIDVVFELIIFFVVTLTEAQKQDDTIELEDGKNGIVLTPEELPPTHMVIDIGVRQKDDAEGKQGSFRVSIADRTVTAAEISRRVKERKDKVGEFPVLIRADYQVQHVAVQRVMDAITAAGLYKISFVATSEDKTYKDDAGISKKLQMIKNGQTPPKGSPRARLLSAFPGQKPKKGGK